MAFLQNTMIDRLFKSMMNRARTSGSKQYYEENIPTVNDIHADDIYLNPIPSTPPTTNTSIVKLYTGSSQLTLTCDTSVANGVTWVALPTWQSGWSSGSNDVTQILKNFISPKYGSNYVVKVFKGDGTQIPQLDPSNWLFDYKAGVLTFENPISGMDGSTPSNSIIIQAYQYVGQMVADATTSAAISGLTDVDHTNLPQDGDLLMYSSNSGLWEPITLTNAPAHFEFHSITNSITRSITLSQSYTPGNNSLMVFLNGSLQLVGSSYDYVETNSTTITFNTPLASGDTVVLRIPSKGYVS